MSPTTCTKPLEVPTNVFPKDLPRHVTSPGSKVEAEAEEAGSVGSDQDSLFLFLRDDGKWNGLRAGSESWAGSGSEAGMRMWRYVGNEKNPHFYAFTVRDARRYGRTSEQTITNIFSDAQHDG